MILFEKTESIYNYIVNPNQKYQNLLKKPSFFNPISILPKQKRLSTYQRELQTNYEFST